MNVLQSRLTHGIAIGSVGGRCSGVSPVTSVQAIASGCGNSCALDASVLKIVPSRISKFLAKDIHSSQGTLSTRNPDRLYNPTVKADGRF
jgi:hypothetical protein